MKKSLPLGLGGIFIALLIQGCAPSSYKVKSPATSDIEYAGAATSQALTLSVKDARADNEKVFSYGILKANLLMDGTPVDPINYIKNHTVKELQARGVDAQAADTGNVDVTVKKLYIRNHRANGFSPFVTLSWLSADVKTNQGNKRIAVFVKRGKVPVWSFDEVIEPTFNEPLSLVIKEFSAKINQATINQSISDDQVNKLVGAIKAQPAPADAYLKVYQLGFGNNKAATKPLVELTKNADEYIRLAAISSLGNLKAVDQFDYLKSLYASGNSWQDRTMALKAICDLGTADALAYAKQAKEDLEKSGKRDVDVEWTRELLGLYL